MFRIGLYSRQSGGGWRMYGIKRGLRLKPLRRRLHFVGYGRGDETAIEVADWHDEPDHQDSDRIGLGH